MSQTGIVIKYLVTVNGGLGAIFAVLQQKIAILTPFQSHFALFEVIGITKLLKFRSHFKRSTFIPPPALLQVNSKISLNACILRLNFLSDLAKGA